ncbi:MAG: hypothetical protein C0622_07575 [Desulfuromonas sp.]|nr:MAG: hypothetical protein C0622_07575 [Desulfuromonas sp.]
MKTKMMLALAASFVLFSGTAFAFHAGGVAHCDGCHSMHNSPDNPVAAGATPNDLLLKGSDASSTCLNCHAGSGGYHISSAIGNNVNQGGDFFWVTSSAVHDVNVRGNIITFDPDNKGHNVVAVDYGMLADGTNTNAPGSSGTIDVDTFGCNSCHDPHGQVDGGTGNDTAAISGSGSYGAAAPVDGSILGNYRLLGDAGYGDITADAPVARANGSSGTTVDYGSGMSNWCLSCHDTYDDFNYMHPVNELVPLAYNSYVASGDFTGDVTTAYDALVPFERGETDGSALDNTSTAGVDGVDDVVMCLSCHRAHASAFDNSLRWDNGEEFLAESAILFEETTTLVANGAVPYYKNGASVDIATEYGEWQRQLCNKCHVQD